MYLVVCVVASFVVLYLMIMDCFRCVGFVNSVVYLAFCL